MNIEETARDLFDMIVEAYGVEGVDDDDREETLGAIEWALRQAHAAGWRARDEGEAPAAEPSPQWHESHDARGVVDAYHARDRFVMLAAFREPEGTWSAGAFARNPPKRGDVRQHESGIATAEAARERAVALAVRVRLALGTTGASEP